MGLVYSHSLRPESGESGTGKWSALAYDFCEAKKSSKERLMRVGMLTGGGDCPGLNAVIRAAVRKGILHHGDEFVGFMEGWRGVLDDVTMPLTLETTSGILRSSRTNVKKIPGGFEKCVEVLNKNKIDALIALGGDDTQSISLALSEK